MSVISFLAGAVCGAVAMKIYIGNKTEVCEEQLQSEHLKNQVREEESAKTQNIEITADGSVEVDPTDEEIIIAAVKTLKRSKSRISLAAVTRESGLSNYKVTKHKELIETLKSK